MHPVSSHACSPRPRRATSALLLALLFSLAVPVVAYAHGALRRAVPASNARLSAAPRELRLTFSERVELSVARITLAGPDGAAVELAPLAAVADSANVIVAAIRGALTAGAYTVSWQIAGRDGHPVRGRYTFTVLPGASGLAGTPAATRSDTAAPSTTPAAGERAGEAGATVTAPGQAPPPATHHSTSTFPATGDFDAESPAYVAIRWLTYAALLVVLGAAAFRVAVLGLLRRAPSTGAAAEWFAVAGFIPDAERRAAALGWWGALALLLAAVARLGAQSVAMHGMSDALDPSRLGAMALRTLWGWGWLLQVVGAAVALLGFGVARRRGASDNASGDTTGRAWTVASVAALILAFTPALSGHAAAAPRFTPLAILSDGLHVVGAGGWLGSLLVVLAAGVPAAFALGAECRGAAVAALVNAFSPTALGFAAVVAVTGVFAGWLHVGRLAALWETGYGQILLAKLAVLSLVAATGAYNWLRVRPTLGHDAGSARIRRSATAELAVGALVLLATAALVATPTPMDDAMARAGEEAPVTHASTSH